MKYTYEFQIWRDGVNTGETVKIKASDDELRSKIKKLRLRYPPDEFYELKNCIVFSR